MAEATALTFEQFQQAMCDYASKHPGISYPGDEYYKQECWMSYYESGSTPEDAVEEDRTYWDG